MVDAVKIIYFDNYQDKYCDFDTILRIIKSLLKCI